jgi:hypothetical protein
MKYYGSIICIFIITGVALAQDPANYHLIYGNKDGSPMEVQLGAVIEVPIWIATDPNPGTPDTLEFVVNPLASNDSIIISRNGGLGSETCDTFFNPQFNHPRPGYTTQTHSRLDTSDCWIFTGGDTVSIASFLMTTTDNTAYLGQIVCPFINGGPVLWGMAGGLRSVIPTQTYGCLYFASVADISDKSATPGKFSLAQNYPNPFNPETNIDFVLPQQTYCSLIIYDLLGQKICTLFESQIGPGNYKLHWNGKDEGGLNVPSGIYFYKLHTAYFDHTNKMVLVR